MQGIREMAHVWNNVFLYHETKRKSVTVGSFTFYKLTERRGILNKSLGADRSSLISILDIFTFIQDF